jgi:hypothetical protein
VSRDDVMQLVIQAEGVEGVEIDVEGVAIDDSMWVEFSEKQLMLFAALVAAAEREACCKIVYGQCESDNVAQRTVDAIRARGET